MTTNISLIHESVFLIIQDDEYDIKLQEMFIVFIHYLV